MAASGAARAQAPWVALLGGLALVARHDPRPAVADAAAGALLGALAGHGGGWRAAEWRAGRDAAVGYLLALPFPRLYEGAPRHAARAHLHCLRNAPLRVLVFRHGCYSDSRAAQRRAVPCSASRLPSLVKASLLSYNLTLCSACRQLCSGAAFMQFSCNCRSARRAAHVAPLCRPGLCPARSPLNRSD